jgi:hypothetical protein
LREPTLELLVLERRAVHDELLTHEIHAEDHLSSRGTHGTHGTDEGMKVSGRELEYSSRRACSAAK